nr:MAG TPA: hypothetical protein [Siphoviridae sp. cta6m1]
MLSSQPHQDCSCKHTSFVITTHRNNNLLTKFCDSFG